MVWSWFITGPERPANHLEHGPGLIKDEAQMGKVLAGEGSYKERGKKQCSTCVCSREGIPEIYRETT